MVWFPMRFELEKMILVRAAIDEEEDGLSCITMRNQMVIDENYTEEYKDNELFQVGTSQDVQEPPRY